MKQITINNKSYNVAYTLRAMMIWEAIAGRPAWELKTMTDQYLMYYSMLRASNPDTFEMTFDAFIDVCDDSPEITIVCSEVIRAKQQQQGDYLTPPGDGKKKRN